MSQPRTRATDLTAEPHFHRRPRLAPDESPKEPHPIMGRPTLDEGDDVLPAEEDLHIIRDLDDDVEDAELAADNADLDEAIDSELGAELTQVLEDEAEREDAEDAEDAEDDLP